jgi:hypothetical protein
MGDATHGSFDYSSFTGGKEDESLTCTECSKEIGSEEYLIFNEDSPICEVCYLTLSEPESTYPS